MTLQAWLGWGALTVLIIIGLLGGIRKLTDEKANFQNDLKCTATICVADDTILKQYEGMINIEPGQGYEKSDWDGKHYIYCNCYIRTIGDIKVMKYASEIVKITEEHRPMCAARQLNTIDKCIEEVVENDIMG